MASSSNNAFMQSSNVDFPYPAFLGDYPFDSGLNQYDAVQQAPPPNLSGLESTFSSRQQEEKARDDALAQRHRDRLQKCSRCL
ncbi:hypothetical protein HBI83_259800 [Parastagonospora nodorum]|nr:hypothetical protein HBI83_259800 [Parastagonospora nodorum]